MQIVIEIPESVKQAFDKATEDDIYGCYYDHNSIIGRAIKNGVPIEDAISRQAVLDMVEDMTDQFGNKHRVVTEGMISLLPSVTPKQKKGHWIYIRNSEVNGLKIVECSECGKRTYGSGNYCPNCGAKMIALQESEE